MNDNVQNGEVIIDINDLSKAFGDLKVLTNISTQIRKGDVVCVIGPSGSGKSKSKAARVLSSTSRRSSFQRFCCRE